MDNQTILYSDSLVEITEDSILFRDYYYPRGSKRVNFSDIENMLVKKPTLMNGRWRLWAPETCEPGFQRTGTVPPEQTYSSSRCAAPGSALALPLKTQML